MALSIVREEEEVFPLSFNDLEIGGLYVSNGLNLEAALIFTDEGNLVSLDGGTEFVSGHGQEYIKEYSYREVNATLTVG